MRLRDIFDARAPIALLLVILACSSPREEEERVDERPPAMEEVLLEGEEPPSDQNEAAEGVVADTSEEEAEAQPDQRPAAVAAAPEVEVPPMKNWMLIEFASAVEDADLEWLKENGFRVDTVMSSVLVRGWLELPEGGEAIAKDPRVARIHAQMR